MDMKIEHKNGDEGQFFIKDNGKTLAILYSSIEGKKLIIKHTEMSEQLKGTGTGRKLVDKAVGYGRSSGYEVTAECEYSAHVLKRDY